MSDKDNNNNNIIMECNEFKQASFVSSKEKKTPKHISSASVQISLPPHTYNANVITKYSNISSIPFVNTYEKKDKSKQCCRCLITVQTKAHVTILQCKECAKFHCRFCMRTSNCLECISQNNENHGEADLYLAYYSSINKCYFCDIAGIIFSVYHVDGPDGISKLNKKEMLLKGRGIIDKQSYYNLFKVSKDINVPYECKYGKNKITVDRYMFNDEDFGVSVVHNLTKDTEHDFIYNKFTKPIITLTNDGGVFKRSNHQNHVNTQNFILQHGVNKSIIRRATYFHNLAWKINNSGQKNIYYTKNDIHKTFNEFDLKKHFEIMQKIDFGIQLCGFSETNIFGAKYNKLTINCHRYHKGSSLYYHQDLHVLNKKCVAIYHAEHQLIKNVCALKQIKYLSFSGCVNQPKYYGMMISWPVSSLLFMGFPAGYVWFHGVPPVQCSSHSSVQFRALL